MFNKVLLFILSTSFYAPPSYAKKCDLIQFLKDHRSQFQTSAERHTFRDGTSMENPFFLDERSTSGSDFGPSPQTPVNSFWREGDIEKLFEEIRGKIRQEISANGVTEKQQKLLNRLNAVQFGGVSAASDTLGTNHQLQNKIVFGQRLLRLPKLAVIQVIAHELAHSIDQCAASSVQCRLNHTGDPSQLIKPGLPSATENNLKLQFQQISSARGLFNLAPSAEAEFRAHLTEFPFLRDESNKIPITQNPTTPTLNCLNKHHGFYNQQTDNWEKTCVGGGSEASAQVWAARILGKYMAEKPTHSPEELIGALAAAQLRNPDTPKGSRLGGKSLDFEMIMMSDPAVARAYGCERTEKQMCMDLFEPSNRSNRNPVQTPSAR